jgi:hypothetical protein
MEEKRRYPRVGTVNLISYLTTDHHGNKQGQGMGTAQNISQNGLRIETARMIDSTNISLLSSDRENNLTEIEGKVVYCKQTQSGKFETGIFFQGAYAEKIQFVKDLVRVFNNRKNIVGSGYRIQDIQQQPCRI